jgi:hypothetical protein
MPIYVKSGGTWREISSDAGAQVYVRDGTSYTNKTINNAYVKDGGSWRTVFTLFDTPVSFTTAGSGTTTFAVPGNANAIHIKQAVGGGAGGVKGAQYDKAGGESGGTGGGSGAFISDKVYTVVGGETLTAVVGALGGKSTGSAYNTTASSGSNTTLSGASTGPIFTLGGGVGGSGTGGGVQGPLRNNNPSSGGNATLGTSLSTGTTVDGENITTFTSGPNSTFNSGGNGVAGVTGTNCGGDNCHVNGGTGGDSYNGNVNGGTAGSPDSTDGGDGLQGSGGGGGGAENATQGGDGGAGELIYRFLRIA